MEGLHVINKPRGTYSQGTSINEHTTVHVHVYVCFTFMYIVHVLIINYIFTVGDFVQYNV